MAKKQFEHLPEVHAAIRKGQFHDLRLLVSAGNDVNIREGEKGLTPLMLCAMLEDEPWGLGIAQMILEQNGLVGLRDKMGRNALMYACIYQRLELTKMFLKAIDFDLNSTDRYGNTALFYASSSGNAMITREVILKLQHFKMNVDVGNRWSMTALMEACRLGHVECATVLRKIGNADDTIRDKVKNWSAADWTDDHRKSVEARKRKRSFHEKPWLPHPVQKRATSLSELSSSSSNSNVPHLVRSFSETADYTGSSLARSRSSSTQDGYPMLGCKQKLKIEKIKRDWIKECVSADLIKAKFYPSPASYSHEKAVVHRESIDLSNPKALTYPPSTNSFRKMFRQYELTVTGSFRKSALDVRQVELPPLIKKDSPRDDRNKSPRGLSRRQSALNVKQNINSQHWSSTASVAGSTSSRRSKGSASIASGFIRALSRNNSAGVPDDKVAAKMVAEVFRRRRSSNIPESGGQKIQMSKLQKSQANVRLKQAAEAVS